MTKFSQTKIPYTVQSDSNNLIKLVLKICLTSIEDCEWTKKELELSFSPIKFIVFKRVRLKKFYSAIVPHLLFWQIYTAW